MHGIAHINIPVWATHMHTGLPHMLWGAHMLYGADANFTQNTAHMAI